eukprot:GGOE01009264.1.p3 GENE.GGOE01009264.1~~GGOE01009264.1.p3  ORF type:complete len:145 (+),score=11.55 GGOE01009264.1:177-611(+)
MVHTEPPLPKYCSLTDLCRSIPTSNSPCLLVHAVSGGGSCIPATDARNVCVACMFVETTSNLTQPHPFLSPFPPLLVRTPVNGSLALRSTRRNPSHFPPSPDFASTSSVGHMGPWSTPSTKDSNLSGPPGPSIPPSLPPCCPVA